MSATAYVYDKDIPEDAEVFEIEDFRDDVRNGMFNDDDGGAKPVKDGRMSEAYILCSDWTRWPQDATQVAWFSK